MEQAKTSGVFGATQSQSYPHQGTTKVMISKVVIHNRELFVRTVNIDKCLFD